MTSLAPILEPDPDAMLRHVQAVFGDAEGGLVELAWTDPETRQIAHAQMFGTDRLPQLVERASALNRTPYCNLYIGAALRQATTPAHQRSADIHFLAAPWLWIDIDDDIVNEAVARCRAAGLMPNLTVVTGRRPHLRAHLWWRLDHPCGDPGELRTLSAALAAGLRGDRKVKNPGRLMRLGGSVSWPIKPGRVLERTEVHLPQDGRPASYAASRFTEAFCTPAPLLTAAPVQPTEPAADAARPDPPSEIAASAPPQPLDLAIGSPTVEAVLRTIRSGRHWHDTVVRLVAHWINRGWSDAEILLAAEALTLDGYTTAQTRSEVAAMIRGARTKWGINSPEHAVGEQPAPAPALNLLDWTADRYAGEARLITWLCRGTIPLGVSVLLAAMGGLGKSYLALDLALHIACGVAGLEQPRRVLGGPIAVEGTAVVITPEDSFDAVHRRLNRIDPASKRLRQPKRLIVLPLADAGGARPLVVTNGKGLARAPFLDELKRQLLKLPDLRLVVIDPLQAFALADVNADPAAAQFLWSAMAEIAAETGATVVITHHMRKEGLKGIADGDDAREAIRGTTALVDGPRLTYALWKLDDEAARPVCAELGLAFTRGRIVRGAVVKANDEADTSTHTYTREETGLLVQVEAEPDGRAEPEFTMAHAREVLKEVDRRFKAGTSFSHAPQSGARYLGHFLMRQHGLTKKAASDLIADWLNNAVVGVEECNRRTKEKGLKVLQWL